jgi:hypothetical protein
MPEMDRLKRVYQELWDAHGDTYAELDCSRNRNRERLSMPLPRPLG